MFSCCFGCSTLVLINITLQSFIFWQSWKLIIIWLHSLHLYYTWSAFFFWSLLTFEMKVAIYVQVSLIPSFSRSDTHSDCSPDIIKVNTFSWSPDLVAELFHVFTLWVIIAQWHQMLTQGYVLHCMSEKNVEKFSPLNSSVSTCETQFFSLKDTFTQM